VRLVALLKSCNGTTIPHCRFREPDSIHALGRLQQAINKPANHTMPANEAKALSILIFIVSLLAEHCNFDRVKTDVPGVLSANLIRPQTHLFQLLLPI
jgi:hypothetical protein